MIFIINLINFMLLLIQQFYMIKFTTFLLLTITTICQQCLNSKGQPVEWWIVLKVPPKIGNDGYGYYDSVQGNGQILFVDSEIDVEKSPLTLTFENFNKKNYSRIAWNDQKPTNQTSSSSAHSKGFLSFDFQTEKGFLISHSIPKYPAFQDGKVNPKIGDSQLVYGQHISCFTLLLKQLESIAEGLRITRPFIYQSQVDSTFKTINLYQLSKINFTSPQNPFQTYDIRSVYGYNLKTIFKDGKINSSIIEDGLTEFLGSSTLVAQTWGRPLQPAWCSETKEVKNALTIKLGDWQWKETDDHSKWILAGDTFSCFGDMNRMTSQWKRGGSYYCLSDPTLLTAMKKLIQTTDECIRKRLLQTE